MDFDLNLGFKLDLGVYFDVYVCCEFDGVWILAGFRLRIENCDFHENLEVRKVMSCGVGWTPRACLRVQKHSGYIPGWFLIGFWTSENVRNSHDF